MELRAKSFMEEAEKEGMRKLLSTLTEGLESQLDSGFFQDGNDVQKTENNNNEIQQHKSKNQKFIFHFNNWKHHKNNIVLPIPTKNRVSEQPTKSKVPENEITITQLQLQQKQQNEQQKEEILEAGKRPESYEKSCSSF